MGKRIDIEDNLVVEKYNELKNIYKVAVYFKVSTSPIHRILTRNGVDLTNRRFNVNKNYFDIIDTEEKAYWLGFLYADGYIRERKSGNSLEMKLSIKDKKHLELFRESIGSNHKITDGFNSVKYKDKISRSHMSSLAIYSKELVKSIKNQGMHSRKTFTISKPNIDKKLIHHFVRGYFDGDGCFYFKNKNRNSTTIACASEKFREFLINVLLENDMVFKWYGGITIHIQSKVDNLKFYNYIYKNAKIYLNRKKEKYEEFRRYYGYNN
jgi:intein-encoded DNA endonuclease-like protein